MPRPVPQKYRSNQCLNCQHPLDISDKFCPNCGQVNTKKRLSTKDFLQEFLSNFYAYDSKIKATITTLFTRPGVAAKEFVEGKRQQYANPFRFYLSVSLLYFILSGITDKLSNYGQVYAETPETKKKKEVLELKEIQKILRDTTPVTYESEAVSKSKPFFRRHFTRFATFEKFHMRHPDLSIHEALDSLHYEKNRWNAYLYKKSIDSRKMMGFDMAGKNEFKDYLYSKLPFILFISLPFLTFIFLLVYVRSNVNYAEHLVFVFNFMSFIFLLFLLDEIVNIFISFDLLSWMLIGVPFYFYKSLRNFYQQKRWKTILKFVILDVLLSITALITTIGIILTVFLLY